VVDLVRWLNWTTFDIIGELVFAEPFGCLEEERGHPLVDAMPEGARRITQLVAVRYAGLWRLRVVRWLAGRLRRRAADNLGRELREIMCGKVRRRLELKEERVNLFQGLVNKRHEWVSS
jgi:hypothetical protein